jgi:3-hydroxyisobutyrate dehydrogenase/2-hydroxy-3-oxopropionate reductase
VAGARVVLVSLADDEAALAAYHGEGGLLAGLAEGAVVCDTSTLDPRTVARLGPEVAARGAVLLDAPVSGSVSVAEAGRLTFMVGGDEAALERVRPVLGVLGGAVVRIGGPGAGATMKLVVNSVLLGLNQALAEGLVLAERAGVDRATAYDVLAAGAVGAPFVQYKRDAFLDPDGTAVAFTLDLVAKDLRLAAELAQRVGARADQLGVNRALAEEAVAAGHGGADLSAVARAVQPS